VRTQREVGLFVSCAWKILTLQRKLAAMFHLVNRPIVSRRMVESAFDTLMISWARTSERDDFLSPNSA
jgi:hypothetical protein